MKHHINALLILCCLSSVVQAEKEMDHQMITTHQYMLNDAPANYFSGKANFTRYPIMQSQGDIVPAMVNFEAGTMTNWHTHLKGQYLIVTKGEGRTQEWGKPIQTIYPGDVIWCPPHVKHWHGASDHSAMSHIAITPVIKNGQGITWLEPVNLPKKETSIQESVNTQKIEINSKQLSLISIASMTAIGDLEKLKIFLIKGLENNLTVNEIKQVFVHQSAYIGFPRALNATLTFKSLLDERQKQGIKDIQGIPPSKLPIDTNYYELGIERLAYLNKTSIKKTSKPLLDNFSPTMDYALKAYLFGYLFSQDNLSPLDREIVVVSTLSTMSNVNTQLRSHLKIIQNLGIDHIHMQKIMNHLQQHIGQDLTDNAQNVLNQLQLI